MPHELPDGRISPLDRLDITNNGLHFSLNGESLPNLSRPVRFYHGPGVNPGELLSGVWIANQRQYGIAVYRGDEWLFSVGQDIAEADAAYGQIDELELEP